MKIIQSFWGGHNKDIKKLNTKLSSSQEITFYKTGTNIIKQLLCSIAIAIEP